MSDGECHVLSLTEILDEQRLLGERLLMIHQMT